MRLFGMRRIVTPIMIVLIFAFGVMNSNAAEKVKLSDTRYWIGTKTEVIKLDDTEGHIIQITESKGVDIGSKRLAVAKNIWDLVKGAGTIVGYTTIMEPDGRATRFLKQEGKVTTVLSPEGKPIITMEGTFTVVKGVGEWAGSTGSGTWKTRMIAEGVFVMDWQGEFVKP
jgi:hypothetical protein